MTSVDELKERFSSLTDEEKLIFVKSIMPSFSEAFSKNPQGTMLFCQEMMKSCATDMRGMMKMMAGMMNPGKSGSRPNAFQIADRN
jgi:hypothetical protein